MLDNKNAELFCRIPAPGVVKNFFRYYPCECIGLTETMVSQRGLKNNVSLLTYKIMLNWCLNIYNQIITVKKLLILSMVLYLDKLLFL